MRRFRGVGGTRVVAGLLVAIVVVGNGCRRPAPREPVRPAKPAPAAPVPVETAISDIATGGSWEENGQSGILRVVVRSDGRRNMRSDVALQWLRWDDKVEQPIEVKSVPITELGRGGIIVTASRIDVEEGRP